MPDFPPAAAGPFPQGPGFSQQRYLAAFEGLTKRLAAVEGTGIQWEFAGGVRFEDKWEEMFEALTSDIDEERARAREGEAVE